MRNGYLDNHFDFYYLCFISETNGRIGEKLRQFHAAQPGPDPTTHHRHTLRAQHTRCKPVV